jgi:hypothetical protein
MKFLNYLWDIVKRYLWKSKKTKHTSEIDIVEETPFMRTQDENEEEVIHFAENNETGLVPVKIYLSHTMNERLGPNDFYMVYEKIEKDTTHVLYL